MPFRPAGHENACNINIAHDATDADRHTTMSVFIDGDSLEDSVNGTTCYASITTVPAK